MNTWQKGEIAKLKVIQKAIEKGAIVSQPTYEQARYDLIIDQENLLQRVQIKYAGTTRPQNTGAVHVDFRKQSRVGNPLVRLYSEKEIDAILIYLPQVDEICKFGPEYFSGKNGITIRYEKAKNGQSKGCIFYEDHLW